MIDKIISYAQRRNMVCQVSGIPRSGSTFIQREIFKHQVNRNIITGYCDEAYRIVPGLYEIQKDNKPSIRTRNNGQITGKIEIPEEYTWPRNYTPETITLRLNQMRERLQTIPDTTKVSTKVFPIDFEIMKIVDPIYHMNLLSDNHWVVTYRRKWFDGILSFFHAAETSQFHYYNDEEFMEMDFKLNPKFTKAFLVMFKRMYETFATMKNTTYITSEEISQIKPVELNTLVRSNENWWVNSTPKFIEDKSELMREKCSNYDRVYDMTRKYMEEICKESNGFFQLDGEDLYVKSPVHGK